MIQVPETFAHKTRDPFAMESDPRRLYFFSVGALAPGKMSVDPLLL